MAYFANSTEGDTLTRQCDDCPLGQLACPILHVQMAHNYDQCSNEQLKQAMNLLVNEKGVCQLRPLLWSRERGDESVLQMLERTAQKEGA